MAVTIIRSDGSQKHINGRGCRIVDWVAKNADQLSLYQRLKIEINCAGDDIEIKTVLAELSEKLPRSRD